MNANSFAMFKTRAEAVSAEVHHFPGRAEALDFILQILAAEKAPSSVEPHAVWADCPLLAGLDKALLTAKAPGLTFDVTRENAAGAKVGISQLDWAIANTGTLVQDATAVDKRLVSTLPLIHIAVVESGRIVADLPSLLAKVDPNQANYISFITGPSRTADIERVLTIGVHGPERLIIVFVGDPGEPN
jgi:L-lactate dehydrogenase complex protein LldG